MTNTEQFQNQVAQTAVLVSALSAIATSCLVSNPANFPVLLANQQFRMAIQDTPESPVEFVLVTATSGPTFTIQRGIEGTAGITHIAGAQAAAVGTQYHFSAMFPNGKSQTGASPYTFDGTLPIMEIAPATPAASTVSIVTGGLVPFRMYVIADGSNNAGTNHITITPDVGQINNAANIVISANNGVIRFYWNGVGCRLA